MAVFDPSEQRLCLRVVYDGAAGAGKTTNVRQLGSLFVAQRITEVVSPAELCGRTLFFDWMQISAGAICGFPLICQVVSVPGQAAFTERRRQLLASADVVVFVCDSSEKMLARAAEALLLADELVLPSGEALPVVFQANKQDQKDAVTGKTLLGATRRPHVHVVEAIASQGIGVVDTFVAAVRTAARALQTRVDAGELHIPVRRAEDENELLARLLSIPIDPEAAAEVVLEEASAAYIVEEAGTLREPHAPVHVSRPILEPEAPSPEPLTSREDLAPLPTGDVPTGYIWPAHTGRVMLRALALDAEVPVGQRATRHVTAGHVLTTSLADRFTDAELARQALVRAARERTQLEALLVPETVLVVQPAKDGSQWLWMVAPCLEDVVEWVADSRARLDLLGNAVADATVAALRHSVAFVPALGAFGVQSGTIRYAGPLETASLPARAAIDLLLGSFEDAVARGIDPEPLLIALTRRLDARLRSEELTLLSSESSKMTSRIDVPGRVARDRLARALRGVRRRHDATEAAEAIVEAAP